MSFVAEKKKRIGSIKIRKMARFIKIRLAYLASSMHSFKTDSP
jgi:hypothetical protein